MNLEDFSIKVNELHPQIIKALTQHEHNYLSRGQITLPQFWALDYLYSNGKSKMNILAKHLKISPAATTGLIDRLITQNLVIRKNGLDDRRIVWIELTSKGRDVISDIKRQKIHSLVKIFDRISPEDRKHYLNILEQLLKITNSFTQGKHQRQA
jgi:DNA-binding MarR family transcriptional regulator